MKRCSLEARRAVGDRGRDQSGRGGRDACKESLEREREREVVVRQFELSGRGGGCVERREEETVAKHPPGNAFLGQPPEIPPPISATPRMISGHSSAFKRTPQNQKSTEKKGKCQQGRGGGGPYDGALIAIRMLKPLVVDASRRSCSTSSTLISSGSTSSGVVSYSSGRYHDIRLIP